MKTSSAAWVSTWVILLAAAPAHADVVSTTGMVQLVDAPANVSMEQTVSDEHLIVFDEAQGVALPRTLDAVIDYQGGIAVMIDEGVVVDSHLLHADLPGDAGRLEFSGTVTFADPIIGMIVTNESLSATDERLGAAGTFYGMDPFREPDLGFDSARVAADPRVLEVSLAVDTGLDQIRVLTSPGDVPIPEDAAVMPEDAAVDPEDAAVDALGDATVPPIDEPSGAQFRGAGGCACDASGGQPMTETASFIAIFLVLLARRRR